MTAAEADQLARTIMQTWRADPAMADIWADVLRKLDRGQATATYEQLRNVEHKMPSIARWREVYRSFDIPDNLILEGIDAATRKAESERLRGLLADATTVKQRAAAYIAFGQGHSA